VKVVRAEGDPGQRGRQVGRALGDPIGRSLAFYRRWLGRRGCPPGRLPELLGPFRAAAARGLPEALATVEGMAEGAGVPFWELFAVNAFEELEPLLQGLSPRARCSTLTVAGGGATLLGHNEQWLAGDLGNAAVVVELPAGPGPALASPTVACCLPAVGLNAHRAAQGIQSLAAFDDRVGVPRVLVSRHALEARDPEDAVGRAALAGRAGGYGHSLAFAGGAALGVETTATRVAVRAGPGAHTNHYTDPGLAAHAPAPSLGSAARLARLEALAAERAPATPRALMEVLADHAGAPEAICVHDDGDEESTMVVFSMVCDLQAGRMWVAPGPPCRTPFEEVDLTGVVQRPGRGPGLRQRSDSPGWD
jgi:isopenicillin-N N-acyltransferase like protein